MYLPASFWFLTSLTGGNIDRSAERDKRQTIRFENSFISRAKLCFYESDSLDLIHYSLHG